MTRAKDHSRLSVVMPVYNERSTIEEILWRVQAVPINKEIIIVDDGSTDGTREFLIELSQAASQNQTVVMLPRAGRRLHTENIRIFFLEKNSGKGAALRRAFKEVQGEIVIIQDADLELDPQDYHKLLEPIEQGTADVVYGSRFLEGSNNGVRLWHALGNKSLTLLSNLLTSLHLTDVWTCYKVFRRELLQELELRENRFGFEPEVTAKVAKHRWRVREVPISYHSRTYADGKKIGWKDGIRGIWCTLWYCFFD